MTLNYRDEEQLMLWAENAANALETIAEALGQIAETLEKLMPKKEESV